MDHRARFRNNLSNIKMRKIIILLAMLIASVTGYGQGLLGCIVPDKPSGGALTSGVTCTVDNSSYFKVRQTTAGQIITIPASGSISVRTIVICNDSISGSVPFILQPGGVLPLNKSLRFDWVGNKWITNGEYLSGDDLHFLSLSGGTMAGDIDFEFDKRIHIDVGGGVDVEYVPYKTSYSYGPPHNVLRTYAIGSGSYANPQHFAALTQSPSSLSIHSHSESNYSRLEFNGADGSATFNSSSSQIGVQKASTIYKGIFNAGSITADRSYRLPDSSGTVALSEYVSNSFLLRSGGIMTGNINLGSSASIRNNNDVNQFLSFGLTESRLSTNNAWLYINSNKVVDIQAGESAIMKIEDEENYTRVVCGNDDITGYETGVTLFDFDPDPLSPDAYNSALIHVDRSGILIHSNNPMTTEGYKLTVERGKISALISFDDSELFTITDTLTTAHTPFSITSNAFLKTDSLSGVRDFQFTNASGNIPVVKFSSPPSGPTDAGEPGQVIISSGYAYYCVAPSTWVRQEVEVSW